jgi:hypothetical protein
MVEHERQDELLDQPEQAEIFMRGYGRSVSRSWPTACRGHRSALFSGMNGREK